MRIRQRAEAEPIGLRTFDDLYRLGRGRAFTVADEESAITMRAGAGYDYAQVWVPAGRPFVALEPMVSRTNGLVDGSAPVVPPGRPTGQPSPSPSGTPLARSREGVHGAGDDEADDGERDERLQRHRQLRPPRHRHHVGRD